jgi:hypothetical protein
MKDFYDLIGIGDENRATFSTNLNSSSSRSHALLKIQLTRRASNQDNDFDQHSSLIMCDLAGSERFTTINHSCIYMHLIFNHLSQIFRAAASTGLHYMRLEEAKSINLSLSALGNCMRALAENRSHIPYRDSKLTRLLQVHLFVNV